MIAWAKRVLILLRSFQTRRYAFEQVLKQFLEDCDPEYVAEEEEEEHVDEDDSEEEENDDSEEDENVEIVHDGDAIVPRLSADDVEEFTRTRTFHASEASADMNPEAESCNICYEDFKEGDKLRLLPCMHVFHAECVDRWLLVSCICTITWKFIGIDNTWTASHNKPYQNRSALR